MKYIAFILIGLWSFRANAIPADSVSQRQLLELEFGVYTSTSDSLKASLIIEKAKKYTEIQMPTDALNELNRLANTALNPGQTLLRYYYQALNYKLANKPDEAYLKIALINETDFNSEEWRTNYMLLKYAILAENNKFLEFKKSLRTYLTSTNDTTHINELNKLPDGVILQNPNTNYKASGFLPGLGLIKINHWGAGLTSFALVGGMAAFSTFCYFNSFYIMGTATGLNWGHRFYKGGKRYSYNETLNTNNEKQEALQLKYKSLVQKIFLN